MSWLAPDIEVTIDGHTESASVGYMELTAARGRPIATVVLRLSNVRGEWNQDSEALAAGNCPLVIRWGYRGNDLFPLFDGTVKTYDLQETLTIVGQCRCRALADARITRTYHNETVDAVVSHLVVPHGFALVNLSTCDQIIDKLPLQNDTIVSALEWINRRLNLGYSFWTDPEGQFHWHPEDLAQEAEAIFTQGEDVLCWERIANDRRLLTVMGIPIWHSQVIEVATNDGLVTRYFVDQVRHTAGVSGNGLRTMLWLRQLA